ADDRDTAKVATRHLCPLPCAPTGLPEGYPCQKTSLRENGPIRSWPPVRGRPAQIAGGGSEKTATEALRQFAVPASCPQRLFGDDQPRCHDRSRRRANAQLANDAEEHVSLFPNETGASDGEVTARREASSVASSTLGPTPTK